MTLVSAEPETTEQRVIARIDNDRDDLIATLARLVGFRTPNPPGGNEAEAQSWVEAELRALGLETDRWDALPGRPNVVGVLRGQSGSPSVALNGHIDVCEDRQLERWSTDPYEAVVADGAVFGRGTTDMKSGLASFLCVLKALQRERVRLRGDVIVQSVIGEERGEPGTRAAVERGYKGDFAIVGEATAGCELVAGIGVVNCRVTIESPTTLHLVARKHTINTGGGLDGANCAEKMATRIIPALLELERQWGVFKRHPRIPPGFCSINLLRIEGGGNTFILPDRCDAFFTVIYLPNETREQVTSDVENQIDLAAQLDPWLRDHPPVVEWNPPEFPVEFAPSDFDPDDPAVDELVRAITDVTGSRPRLDTRGAITDAGWFTAAGVPAVIFGPGDVEYVHRIDERVRTDALVAHCKATALFLMRYCGVSAGD